MTTIRRASTITTATGRMYPRNNNVILGQVLNDAEQFYAKLQPLFQLMVLKFQSSFIGKNQMIAFKIACI